MAGVAGTSTFGTTGAALGGAGRNTKYSTSAIASTSTTLSAMMRPSGTVRFGFTGSAADTGVADFGVGGAGVADWRISIV